MLAARAARVAAMAAAAGLPRMSLGRGVTGLQYWRSLYVGVETTPNPDSLKFVSRDRSVLRDDQGSGYFFTSVVDAKGAPLVQELLRLPGITGVYLGPEFVSVNKDSEASWETLQSVLLGVIMDHLGRETPVLLEEPKPREVLKGAEGEEDDEVVQMIKELLDTRIRPAVQEDGGDIHYRSFDHATGVVKLQMAGSCVGCPSSTATLYNGVENMLMHYIPEVRGIEAVKDEPAPASADGSGAKQTIEDRLRAAGVPE